MVLFVSDNDWCRVGYALAECLKFCGVKAVAVALFQHPFDYPEQANILSSQEELQDCIDESDVVVVMHSSYVTADYRGKRLFVYHGGTMYRSNHEILNRFFNPLIEGSIIQTHDLLKLGAKNEHWLLPPVDTEKIQPRETENGILTFGHFPRHPEVKGTTIIYDIMRSLGEEFNFQFLTSVKQVSWEENLNRISKCDVYIEELAPPYEWGITALEAAALGKIVITDFKGLDRYRNEYGPCPLLVSNTPEELRSSIVQVLEMSRSSLLLRQHDTREWVETYHSYEAVGERLRGILNV